MIFGKILEISSFFKLFISIRPSKPYRRLLRPRIKLARQSKIKNINFLLINPPNRKISRFYISMNQPTIMNIPQSKNHLPHTPQNSRQRKLPIHSLPLQIRQIFT